MPAHLSILFLFGYLVSSVCAWGAIGHEIVATIAQTQLHPSVRQHLCSILPSNLTSYTSTYPRNGGIHQHCHLAPLAAWPDAVRFRYPWSSHLHYVNPVNDEPPKHCTYGEDGWQDGGSGNVLEALVNYTSQVSSLKGPERDIALRFLTHYMGDSHQPLHLTGRARGGNDVAVRFEGRYAKLHTVWDSLLINSQVRQLANYTSKLPSARIESALLGKPYDAYIRWILVEGLGQAKETTSSASTSTPWWADDSSQWTACPDSKQRAAKAATLNSSAAHWLRAITPQSSNLAQRIYSTTFSSVPSKVQQWVPADVDETELPICPYAWTEPMHPLVCSYAFADPVPRPGEEHTGPLAELDVAEYRGRIDVDKVIQKQLAKAGIRLAAVLNTLLLPEALLASEAQSMSQSPFLTVKAGEEGQAKKKKSKSRHGSSQSPIVGLIKVTAASIAEVIILSSVGYILARQGVLDKKTQTKINKLNVSFFTPALLFSKVAFTLNPARLAELIIVPAGFVIITITSTLAALLLSWTANLSKSQRNFSIACAMTPNSNSLPVALMQSLVVTVPQLHWEEEGEPEDTVNGMLGRSLTYLVLFSTLGMFLRWSVASQLLSTMEVGEEEEGEREEESVRTGRLIDYEDESHTPVKQSHPGINVRRSTEDGGRTDPVAPATLTAETLAEGPSGRRPSRSRQGPPAWARSFPNSPADSSESEGEEDSRRSSMAERSSATRSCASSSKQVYQLAIKKPFKAVTSFMTMPLYAAVISLVVALIPPLQKAVASIEPAVGALETAGACSIPLTMVVLGAYFYEEADAPTVEQGPQTEQTHPHSSASTLVGTHNEQNRRKSVPWMRNPWKSNDEPSEAASRNASTDSNTPGAMNTSGYSVGEEEQSTEAVDSLAQHNARLNSSKSSSRTALWPFSQAHGQLSAVERKKKKQTAMERRTIVVAVGSRMILTPLLLLPLVAWWAISTSENVMDDPVFICCACLLVGSPPALTLAQITSQSAKGSNSSFERLISKTIFVSYAILAAPTTIALVLTALLIAEND